MGMPFKLPHMRVISKLLSCCNGYTVTGSRHSRYTESNMYSSCTRVERRLFVHVSDVLYRLHVTSVTNTIYGSYQYLQYNEIEPRNGRPVTVQWVSRQFPRQLGSSIFLPSTPSFTLNGPKKSPGIGTASTKRTRKQTRECNLQLLHQNELGQLESEEQVALDAGMQSDLLLKALCNSPPLALPFLSRTSP